jgi:hypoxanthine-DNA glycosylase
MRWVERSSLAAVRPQKSVGFPPIARTHARVLVLGSLPGRMSLERQQYYAQPRNAFWRIVEALWGIPLALPYEERTRRLALERVALWDVCAAAVRAGSLDTAIVHHTVEPNDFAGFLARHRRIGAVCFNGAKSAELWRRLVAPTLSDRLRTLPTHVLPSTSPANQVLAFEAKLERWRVAYHASRS